MTSSTTSHKIFFIFFGATVSLVAAPVLAQTTGYAISGYVFTDTNGNGVKDSGEAGIAGEIISLSTEPEGVFVRNDITNAAGVYGMPNIAPRAYRISHIVPAGYVRTTDDSFPFILSAPGYPIANFGVQRVAEQQIAPTPGPVIGFINTTGFQTDAGGTFVGGWACQKGVAASIAVHVYANNIHLTSLDGVANVANEAAVDTACKTTGVNHRFKTYIPNTILAQYKGQKLYVYGIHLQGSVTNAALANSGTFVFPAPAPDPIPAGFPARATLPSPANNAVRQRADAAFFSWAPAAGAEKYIIYISPDATITASEGKPPRPSHLYPTSDLAYNTTYYWRIDTVNAKGTTTGDVWHFTTATNVQPACILSIRDANGVYDDTIPANAEAAYVTWNIGNGPGPGEGGKMTLTPGGSSGDLPPSTGAVGVIPTATTTYTATITQTSGYTANCTATVYVTPSSNPVNVVPKGTIESVSASGVIKGWSYDRNTLTTPARVLLYSDGPKGSGRYMGATTANIPRSDINTSQRITGNHGFTFTIPPGYRDGQLHTLYAYAIDTVNGLPTRLSTAVGAGSYNFPMATTPACTAVRAPAAAGAWVDLDFESGSLTYVPSSLYTPYRYTEQSQAFTFTIGDATRYSDWLSRQYASTGCKSLALEISSDVDGSVQDKNQFDVARASNTFAPDVNSATPKYLAFDMWFDQSYEVATDYYVLHMQALQESVGLSPALSMQLVPNTSGDPKTNPIDIVFYTRDNSSVTGPAGNKDRGHITTITRGGWNHFVVKLLPSAISDSRTGQLVVWLNGVQTITYNGDWGFTSSGADTNNMTVSIGTYRKLQDNKQLIFVDNVRFGPTYASVAP